MTKTKAISTATLEMGAAEAWTSAHKLAASLAALAFLADGMGTQAMGLALPSIIKDWAIPRAALASATAFGLMGFAAGAAFGGLCGDRFGRRFTLIASLLLLGLATAACGLVHDTNALCVVRVFAGLGLGASLPSAATMIAEATPARHRSVALSIGLAFLPLGGFIEAMAASFVLPAFGWRGLFVGTGLTALLFSLVIAVYHPASPYARSESESPRRDARRSFHDSLARLLTADRLKDTIGLWFAFFLTVLIYYSVFSWFPAGLAGHGESPAVTSRAMSAFSLGGLVGGLLAGWLVKRLGSRLPLRILCGGAAVTAVVLAALFRASHVDASLIVCAVGLLGACTIALQTALFALGAFLYDTQTRATGIGMAVGCGRIGAIVSSYAGVLALDRQGLSGFFLFIGCAAILALGSVLIIGRQLPRNAAPELADDRA